MKKWLITYGTVSFLLTASLVVIYFWVGEPLDSFAPIYFARVGIMGWFITLSLFLFSLAYEMNQLVTAKE
jgi:hypothetical protein